MGLSTRGIRAQGERSRLRAWCVTQGYAMSYDCPHFRELDNGEVVLQVHAPPFPRSGGMIPPGGPSSGCLCLLSFSCPFFFFVQVLGLWGLFSTQKGRF